jgi:methionyl-tRNA formyltransferase
MEQKTIIFFGIYLSVLATIADKLHVKLVVIETKKNSAEIKKFCDSNNLKWIEISSLDELSNEAATWHKPIGIVASFGLLFKSRHIDWFAAVFNFHPGCIYTNRGRHPLPNAICRGHRTMAISVHEITDEQIDAGRFIAKIDFPIDYERDYQKNCDRLLSALPFLTQDLCDRIAEGRIPSFELQAENEAYFAPLNFEELSHIMNAPTLTGWTR